MFSSTRMFFLPASFFAMVLGLAGLGNAWRRAHQLWGVPAQVGEALMAVAALVWLVLLVWYVLKWCFAREQALAEARHPVQCCFIGLAGVSTMVIAGAALPYGRALALALLTAGASATLGFAVWRTGMLWRGGREEGGTTAVLYLPSVAGGFVTAALLAALGQPAWGQLAFGAGAFSWLAIESVLLHRLYTGPPLPVPLRPTLGIQLAPPTVGLLAYLAVTPGQPDLLSHALLGYGLLQALILLRMMPWLGQAGYVPAYWGYSFGLTALAAAPLALLARGDGAGSPAATLALPVFVIVNALILALAILTVHRLLTGRLLVQPADEKS